MSGLILPAITLWQPWACLIEIGAKPYETRSKPPPQRLIGQRIAIHAALRKPRVSDVDDVTFDAMCDAFGRCNWNHSMPLGVIVCTAILTSAHRVEDVPHDEFGDYSPGRFAWKLEDVFPITPHIPAKGQQLWGWPWHVPPGVAVSRSVLREEIAA